MKNKISFGDFFIMYINLTHWLLNAPYGILKLGHD